MYSRSELIRSLRETDKELCDRQNMNLPASRVLLVEDDLKMPELLSALLQGVNITLSYAANAADARRLVRDTHFDLIVLDLGLPDINGFELLRQFKDTPETRSIPSSFSRLEQPQGQTARV